MKIIYTTHAKKRMIERDIKESLVKEGVELPDYNITTGIIVESNRQIDDRILRVIWTNKDSFIKVISVMWK